jgi:hypothetical protein
LARPNMAIFKIAKDGRFLSSVVIHSSMRIDKALFCCLAVEGDLICGTSRKTSFRVKHSSTD